MNALLEKFGTWFSGLNESAQIDEVIVGSIGDFLMWFGGLSLNQQLVLLGMVVISLALIFILFRLCRNILFRGKRWYRREKIPHETNPHLGSESGELKYGEKLKYNMTRMREHAPFKSKP